MDQMRSLRKALTGMPLLALSLGTLAGAAHADPVLQLYTPGGPGQTSFYDNGTTAMRLPRGTLIRVCGGGGCLERVVNDYGPSASFQPVRIIDMYRPDFFAVCGCPSWSGTAQLTVAVY